MTLTDTFIKRPVLATVVSLLILLLGLRSIASLELREYPKTEQALVTVTTAFPGADADLVQSFITEPLQRAASEAEGIDYVTSISRQGVSIIQAYMALNYDPYDALAEIQGKIGSERNSLPQEAEDPVITLSTSEGWALIYMALVSEDMNTAQMTDYTLRSIVPRLQALPGVAKASINGDQTMALRVWLDPVRLTALDLTAADVRRPPPRASARPARRACARDPSCPRARPHRSPARPARCPCRRPGSRARHRARRRSRRPC